MQNIALILEYDGSEFHGWQKQGNQRTVQLCLEQALSAVANHPVSVFCAGRTDAGVHALKQVVHFFSQTQRSEQAWILGTNSCLPADIRIVAARTMSPDFHARFSAKARTYEYIISNQKVRPALYRNYLSWQPQYLNTEAMQEAANYLIGELDFSSFRGSSCQSKSPFRCVYHLSIDRSENLITLRIKANAFLQHMVRNIAGTLMNVGLGKKEPIWAKEVLLAKDRSAAGITAPASGLYLIEVDYPSCYELPMIKGAGPYANSR